MRHIKKRYKDNVLYYVLILFTYFFFLPAQLHAQNTSVSLSVKNTSLKQLLTEIEKKSDIRFSYIDEIVEPFDNITLDVANQPVKSILDKVLPPRNLEYIQTGNTIAIKDKTVQHIKLNKIKGVIKDMYNEPIIGANVRVKGSTTGTITDINGEFELEVPDNAVLQISYIGYISQDVTVKGKTSLDIQLNEDSQALDEVVVVGYGTMRKSDLTGSVARADLKALQNSPNVSIAQTLKGVVPGLTIGTASKAGDSPSISIRGQNSISGTTDPLIVLDGIIYRGNMSDINPNDVESIDILKDASSAAIYGSQAANGVILITTKTVKQMSKPIIEYSGSVSFQSPINSSIKPLDRDGYLQMVTDSHLDKSRLWPDGTVNPDYDITKDFLQQEVLTGYMQGTNTDWYGLMTLDNPYIQNHNLSIRGKNELTSYFLSFGFADQKNMIKNDKYKRYNLRINLDTKITNWLTVGTQSFFVLGDLSGNNPSFNDICSISPLVASHDENGEIITLPTLGNTSFLLLLDNPDQEKNYNLTGNFYGIINIPFVEGLSYRINYSRNYVFNKLFSFNPYANGMLGSAKKNNSSSYAWTFDNIVTYKRTFGKHDINATLVYGIEKQGYENTDASASNFTDMTLGYNYLGAAQSDLNQLASGAWQESSLYMMGRLVYSYDNKYILTATLRRDGFSGFGTNNKFAYFPSAAIAWRAGEENFVKDKFNWLNNLKLRLSYGSNGNRTVGRYQTMATMSSASGYVYGDGGTPELVQSLKSMANNHLKWETTSSFNVGMDFGLFDNRLYGDYEFYSSRTKDLIYNVPIPAMNGFGAYNLPTNIGKLKNYGHELSIGGIPVRNKDFEWNVAFNLSLNRNEVVSILGLDTNGDGKEDDLVSAGIFIGQPLNAIYDYKIKGMWQVEDYKNGAIPEGFTYGHYKIADLNEDGKYTADHDRKILGSKDPSYQFNIRNSFRYKDFDLNIVINSIQGGKNRYLGRPIEFFREGIQWNYFKFDYWTPDNPNAKYRQPGSYTQSLGYEFSPYVSRSFIRLQELSLAYNLPSALIKKVNINHAKVYISGTNLFTITDWDGWDPEAGIGLTGNIKDNANENTGYPSMKSFTIGMSFEF